jgi:chromosome segregation ATPase
MIVDLARQLQDRLINVYKLEHTNKEVGSIEATLSELKTIDKQFEALKAFLQTVHARLDPSELASMATQAEQIADAIEQSQAKFATTLRQVSELKNAYNKLQQLEASVKLAWSTYASAQIKPSRDILTLVESLPEIKAQLENINRLFAQLHSLSQGAVRSSADLAHFDDYLRELEGKLAAVRQLSPEIKDFLDKVRLGTATIADLTASILEWCQADQHAVSFVISFHKPLRGSL